MFSRNSKPRESAMYFLAWERVLSGHQDRMSSNFLKMLKPFSRPDGMSSSSGNSVSHQYFQSFSRDTTWSRCIINLLLNKSHPPFPEDR